MTLKVALAQMTPVWLNREATLEKMASMSTGGRRGRRTGRVWRGPVAGLPVLAGTDRWRPIR